LKIPIYTQLKSKLESKGLDSAASGQIAWFVFSVFVPTTIDFMISLIYNLIIGNLFNAFFINLYKNFYEFIWFLLLLIFIFNLFYIRNAIPIILAFIASFYLILEHKLYIVALCLCGLFFVCIFYKRCIIYFLLSAVACGVAYGLISLIYSLSR
ncbi:hypothetical protein, partial [Helicobacter sp. T3_23-1059]